MESERHLIQRASTLGKVIQELPIENLKPFASEIGALSSTFTCILRTIESQPSESELYGSINIENNTNGAHLDGVDTQLTFQMPDHANEERQGRNQITVQRLLSAINENLSDLIDAARRLDDVLAIQAHLDLRTQHIQSIYVFQKRRLPKSIDAREKILFICACLSLAEEFLNFETYNGWQPKSRQIADRVLRSEEPDVQRISKHFTHFLMAGGTDLPRPEPSDIATLDAALRFGIKLQVVDALGNSIGLGHCLSLVCGFECAKFTRLSYNGFGQLKDQLEKGGPVRDSLLGIETLFGQSWMRCVSEYHHRFGSQTMAQGGQSAPTHLDTRNALSADDFTVDNSTLTSSNTWMNAREDGLLGIDWSNLLDVQ